MTPVPWNLLTGKMEGSDLALIVPFRSGLELTLENRDTALALLYCKFASDDSPSNCSSKIKAACIQVGAKPSPRSLLVKARSLLTSLEGERAVHYRKSCN